MRKVLFLIAMLMAATINYAHDIEIPLNDGWTYRPEGWKNAAANSADTRPTEVTTTKIVIDEAWWGEWTTRAFNIRKTDNSDLTGLSNDVAAAFKIYVPKK